MKTYDTIVIGSGGGSKIVSPAIKRGLKVAVIEKGPLGGTCLNRGCIPSKMLIHPADIMAEMDDAKRQNITIKGKYSVDFEDLIHRVNQEVSGNSDGIKHKYDQLENIDYYPSIGSFVSDKVVEAGGVQMTAEKIFITVGVRSFIPPIKGLRDTPFMTSTEALRNTKQPEKMIVIGGGYIGTELGHFYGATGTEIAVISQGHLVEKEDTEVIAEFERAFTKRYTTHTFTTVTEVSHQNGEFTVTAQKQNGETFQLTSDALLVAAGVKSNADTLNLENTGVKTNQHNFIEVDEHLETTVPGVFAFGDVIGRHLFRHSANFEGEYLFGQLWGGESKKPIEYPPMPHAVFSYPQVAGVGKTEEELQQEGTEYIKGVNPYKSSAMGMALRSEEGFCKLLFEKSTKKLLGAHIVGKEASNMIHMPIAYMNMNATLDDMLKTIYIHPALPEIVRNAARLARAEFEKINVE